MKKSDAKLSEMMIVNVEQNDGEEEDDFFSSFWSPKDAKEHLLGCIFRPEFIFC